MVGMAELFYLYTIILFIFSQIFSVLILLKLFAFVLFIIFKFSLCYLLSIFHLFQVLVIVALQL